MDPQKELDYCLNRKQGIENALTRWKQDPKKNAEKIRRGEFVLAGYNEDIAKLQKKSQNEH